MPKFSVLNEGYSDHRRVSSATGCNIKINGKWLLDTSMGYGTHILGYGFANERIRQALDWGTLYSFPNILADKCGELLNQATGFENFVFCNSGSEATLRAIRLARAYTQRDKIAFFEGGWHGTHDWNLVNYSEGIPQSVKDQVIYLPYTDDAFEILRKERPALVMVEPIQGSLPLDRGNFLYVLRKITQQYDVVLCFDEIISGFRSSLGGASELYGIRPDLACYGKIIGGGFPIGILAGDSIMKTSGVRWGGTFSGNPITMTGAIAVLEYLLNNNIYYDLKKNTESLIGTKTDKLQVIGFGNICRLLFTNRSISTLQERDNYELPKTEQNKILDRFMELGLFIQKNHLIHFSIFHTPEKVRFIKECLSSL